MIVRLLIFQNLSGTAETPGKARACMLAETLSHLHVVEL